MRSEVAVAFNVSGLWWVKSKLNARIPLVLWLKIIAYFCLCFSLITICLESSFGNKWALLRVLHELKCEEQHLVIKWIIEYLAFSHIFQKFLSVLITICYLYAYLMFTETGYTFGNNHSFKSNHVRVWLSVLMKCICFMK